MFLGGAVRSCPDMMFEIEMIARSQVTGSAESMAPAGLDLSHRYNAVVWHTSRNYNYYIR